MTRVLRRGLLALGVFLCALAGAALLWLNARLVATPANAYPAGGLGPDIVAQLDGIGRRLRAGEGRDMQAIFPEGWFFSHMTYGYAWVNVGLATGDPALRARAIAETRWVLERADSPEGLAPFTRATQVPHGVFYLGWTNRLLGGLMLLQAPAERSAADLARLKTQSRQLADAMRASPSGNLDAYPGQSWPCDNVVALASLAAHDAVFGPTYADVMARWVTLTRAHLDPATGLIPHAANAATGVATIGPRASTQVYIHAFLPEVDAAFAREQYARYREVFVTSVVGFPVSLEYPKGSRGQGDVDTGPLVLGIGPSATVVAIASARANGDGPLAERITVLSELLGFPVTTAQGKSFALGTLVVADGFLAWGKSLLPWTVPAPALSDDPASLRLPLHLMSLALLAGITVLALRMIATLRRRKA